MSALPTKQDADGTTPNLRALVAGMGLAQLYAWGVIYYPFSVTAKQIAADLGMSLEATFAGFSLLLLSGAAGAPFAGRAIDKFGGRPTLALGCILGALSLVFAAAAQGPAAFYASCAALGFSSAFALYEAAFAAVVQIAGPKSRRAVTYTTFLGGFASTLFWPITSWASARWGWRATYDGFAVGMLVLNLPLYLAVLRQPAARPAVKKTAGDAPPAPEVERPLAGAARRRAFLWLSLSVGAHQFVIAALLVHLINALQLSGLAADRAIVVGMAFGPGQVLGRLAEMMWGGRFAPLTVGRIAAASLPAAMALMALGSANFALALLTALAFGMSNGLMTIARGVMPLSLFGRQGYGAVVGDLGLVTLFARAGGPIALAYGLDRIGLLGSELAGAGVSACAAVAMEALIRSRRAP